MKKIWSNIVSVLFTIIVVVSLQVPLTSTQPAHVQLGAVALGLVFLAALINTLRLQGPVAGKVVTGFQVLAGVLVIVAVVLAYR